MAENLLELRKARGQSTLKLSAAMEELGQPVPASGITRIEKGDRRVDVDDLVAFALALNVSPNALLLPARWDYGQVNLTPNRSVSSRTAWLWAEGRSPANDYGVSPTEIVGMPDEDDDEDAKDSEYWTQREAYESLTHPPERRRAARHSANRAAKATTNAVDILVNAVLDGDKEAASRRLKAAKLQLRQLENEIAQIELELDN
ncbi:helix-turn-helix domain-containing protein [Streptomyces sp. NBC_01622]|uniref:helix-turn-helix domain-containing protein n=1 Tax=Streptomyces sp. NBC_01622 TaxID=2975903 RepID=UPI00386727B0|nr:helix-turn-helix domain-containing protein [Streptomyces sp. NBC_01622]